MGPFFDTPAIPVLTATHQHSSPQWLPGQPPAAFALCAPYSPTHCPPQGALACPSATILCAATEVLRDWSVCLLGATHDFSSARSLCGDCQNDADIGYRLLFKTPGPRVLTHTHPGWHRSPQIGGRVHPQTRQAELPEPIALSGTGLGVFRVCKKPCW